MFALDHSLQVLQTYFGGLLEQDVVVSFPCAVYFVVVDKGAHLAVAGVPVSSHHLPALPHAFVRQPRGLWLQCRRNEVQLLDDQVLGVQDVRKVLIPFLKDVEVACVINDCLSQQRHHSPFCQWVVHE